MRAFGAGFFRASGGLRLCGASGWCEGAGFYGVGAVRAGGRGFCAFSVGRGLDALHPKRPTPTTEGDARAMRGHWAQWRKPRRTEHPARARKPARRRGGSARGEGSQTPHHAKAQSPATSARAHPPQKPRTLAPPEAPQKSKSPPEARKKPAPNARKSRPPSSPKPWKRTQRLGSGLWLKKYRV